MDGDRSIPELRARWLDLTQAILPRLAQERGWPVAADHCFQRILLDNACGDVWYAHIPGRPAYAAADRAILKRAVHLGEAIAAGTGDLSALNRASLAWRRARHAPPQSTKSCAATLQLVGALLL